MTYNTGLEEIINARHTQDVLANSYFYNSSKERTDELEKEIKQNLMQKDKEVIIELYLQMKFERDYCQNQLELDKNQKAVEALEKVAKEFLNTLMTGDIIINNDIKHIGEYIDQLIKKIGGKDE